MTALLPRFEISLLRVVVGYRAIATVWLLILVVIELGEEPARPEIVIGTAAAVVVWTGLTLWISFRNHEFLSTWPALLADIAFAGLLIFAPDWAGSSNFYGGYPISALLLGIYAQGLTGAIVATIVLTAATVVRVSIGQLSGDPTSVSGAILVFPFVAAPATWGIGVLRRANRLRNEAEERLVEERSQRARAEERAEVARHLHDSVLQTLALIQRKADEPADVRVAARRQERELRTWLYEEPSDAPTSLAAAIRAMGSEVEGQFGVPVQVVVVGEAPVTERSLLMVAAAREAVVNASKHSGAPSIDVYSELGRALEMFIRDRGVGFVVDEIPADRHGINNSIRARMNEAGGESHITSSPGGGTEVRLSLSP